MNNVVALFFANIIFPSEVLQYTKQRSRVISKTGEMRLDMKNTVLQKRMEWNTSGCFRRPIEIHSRFVLQVMIMINATSLQSISCVLHRVGRNLISVDRVNTG